MAASDSNSKTVSELFDEGWLIFNGLTNNYEPTNSLPIQSLIKKSMNLLQDATRLVSVSGIFSTNECIEEVSTKEVKFLLLPALLGTLTLKLCISDRLEVISTAEVYFKDFLERCRHYGIIDFEVPEFHLPEPLPSAGNSGAGIVIPANASGFNMAEMACTRNRKIQRFKEQQVMEGKIAELEGIMKSSNADDEAVREYYLNLIKYFTSLALDELECLYSEKGYLLTKPKEEEPENPRKVRHHPQRAPLKAVVISRRKDSDDEDSSSAPS